MTDTREAFLKIKALCTDPGMTEDNALNDVFAVANSALASLTAPFDPAKFPEWKVMFADEVWRFATPENRWELQWVVNRFWRIVRNDETVFEGEIKTHDFFHALCGALGIKQGT